MTVKIARTAGQVVHEWAAAAAAAGPVRITANRRMPEPPALPSTALPCRAAPSAPRRACRRTQSGTSPCRRRTGTAGGRGRGTCTPGRTRAPAPPARLAAAGGGPGQGGGGEGGAGERGLAGAATCAVGLWLRSQCWCVATLPCVSQPARPGVQQAKAEPLTPSRRLRTRSSRSRCRRSACADGCWQNRASGIRNLLAFGRPPLKDCALPAPGSPQQGTAGQPALQQSPALQQASQPASAPSSQPMQQLLCPHLLGVQLLRWLRSGGGLDAPALGDGCNGVQEGSSERAT